MLNAIKEAIEEAREGAYAAVTGDDSYDNRDYELTGTIYDLFGVDLY